MFLLKPNHALGLCLAPLVLAAVARARGWRGRVAAGLALHLLGWAFVVHMAFVVAGLLAFVLLSWAWRLPERRRETLDVGAVVGVNLLAVSPYLVMLLRGYPFLKPLPMHTIAPYSAHLLEGLLAGGGLMLAAAVWGGRVLWARGDRLSRLWLAQALTALAVWAGYLVLSLLQMARELDEAYYWLRFHTAILAAIGAWDLGSASGRPLGRPADAGGAGRRPVQRAPAVQPAGLVAAGDHGPLLPGRAAAPASHARGAGPLAGRALAAWRRGGRRPRLRHLGLGPHGPPRAAGGALPHAARLRRARGPRARLAARRRSARHARAGGRLRRALSRGHAAPAGAARPLARAACSSGATSSPAGWRRAGCAAREPLAVLRFRPEAGT